MLLNVAQIEEYDSLGILGEPATYSYSLIPRLPHSGM